MIFYIKKTIIFLFLFTVNTAFSQNNWVKISSPVNSLLYKCYFIDSLTGWAAGQAGKIIHTTNGGNSWSIQNSDSLLLITDIYFIDSNTGWGVGSDYDNFGTFILRTTNSGFNWIKTQFSDTSSFLNCIYFRDLNTGFMGALNGVIFKTSNAGAIWTEAQIDSSVIAGFPIHEIKFLDNNFGIACGGTQDFAALIWSTSNGGNTWQTQLLAYEPLYDFEFLSPDKFIACGGDFEYGSSIAVTTNAGINWNFEFLELFGIAHSIEFRTPSEAWMTLSISGNLAYTNDTGNTWQVLLAPDTSNIYDIFFIDSTHGWAVGDNGVILKYQHPIGIKKISENIPDDFMLYQNYPNPFNPVTTIQFVIPAKAGIQSNVKLTIYNSLGQQIKTLLEQNLVPGQYDIEFDGTDHPSGIYFYSLYSNNKLIAAKKMLLIK